MLWHRLAGAVGVLGLTLWAAPLNGEQTPATVSLQQYSYQTVKSSPFNGQLAFYVADIVSTSAGVKLPLTIQILIGNGRRPFATDTGTMKQDDFDRYVARLTGTGGVRVIPFRIAKKGEAFTFQYLSKSFTVTATEAIPCRSCPDRVVLTLN